MRISKEKNIKVIINQLKTPKFVATPLHIFNNNDRLRDFNKSIALRKGQKC